MGAQDLETRIKVLEDIEAIKKLKAKYCYAVDSQEVTGLMALFTEDASVDYGPWGNYDNKEKMTEFFKNIPAEMPMVMHMVHSPIIELNGDTATGFWYFEVPVILAKGNKAAWVTGAYEEIYAKEGTEWKIKKMVCKFNYFTPYDEGWAKTRMYTP